jgi:hypothetical protein
MVWGRLEFWGGDSGQDGNLTRATAATAVSRFRCGPKKAYGLSSPCGPALVASAILSSLFFLVSTSTHVVVNFLDENIATEDKIFFKKVGDRTDPSWGVPILVKKICKQRLGTFISYEKKIK